MKPVVQEQETGCAIASSAAIAGVSYKEARKIANSIGMYAEDSALWSETKFVRSLLKEFGIKTGKKEIPFTSWKSLPNCALLSIKWHLENNKPHWHWVVFVRDSGNSYVLDSKKSLKTNVRTDFGRMKPKWYIEILNYYGE
jgi:ABC-type bacteriocin/lantibiotic exporter with double-glycine peptidase domain